MSVWATKWAYEQAVEAAGAKFVLVALAHFADEEGYCYPSQETLALMTAQTDRTVRSHLARLEEGGLIKRGHRYTKSGERTSDGYNLIAPVEALRPKLPEKSSGSKTDYRKSTTPLPEESSASLPEKFSGDLSVPDQSEDQSGEEGSRRFARSPYPLISELQRNPAYRQINVEGEFYKMLAWCDANGKQATKRRFVNWLNRIDVLAPPPNGHKPPESDKPTAAERQKQLEEKYRGNLRPAVAAQR